MVGKTNDVNVWILEIWSVGFGTGEWDSDWENERDDWSSPVVATDDHLSLLPAGQPFFGFSSWVHKHATGGDQAAVIFPLLLSILYLSDKQKN